ncbi:MAG TPA: M28 family peptidase [Gemmatimonadales bacterium]|nr:M28 family peptidase [Gemmatimonadales bacterium]
MKRLLLLAAAAAAPASLAAQAAQPAEAAAPAVVPAPDTKLPLKLAPRPTKPAITAADLMTRLYIYADDSLQGREAGTIGNVKATDYLAREMQRLGLKPAGENGTYFQTIPLKTRAVDAASSFTAGGTALAFGSEWAVTGRESVALPSVPVIYGGNLGDGNLVDSAQAAGKLVVFTLPENAGRAAMAKARGIAQGAALVALVAPPVYLEYFSRPATFLDTGEAPPAGAPKAQLFLASADKLFDAPVASLQPGAAGKTAAVDVKIVVAPVEHPARNVVAILPGSDPKLRGQYVAIGAHNDHVGIEREVVDHDSLRIFNHIVRPGGAENRNAEATPEQQAQVNALLAEYRAKHPGTQRADSIANGADDDGSGTVAVLEIAEKLASLKGKAAPKRSILFVWHVGEEKGLLGSQWYTDHPTVERDSIVAQLNMDMVGRGNAWDVTGESKEGAVLRGGPNYLQLVGSRRLSTELGDLVEQVNRDGKHGFVFDYAIDANGHPQNIYCRSDHYEYARYGIPVTFFTTGGHSDYHQVTDEPQYIDYDRMARVSQLVEGVALRVANLDHRIVVDQPKPDPHGGCRQ